jgi:hypothetical protein
MSEVTYTVPSDTDWFNDDSYNGWCHERANGADRIITVEEPHGTVLHSALMKLISQATDRSPYTIVGPILVTTEGWWSGYSEYTVTDVWATVVVTAPAIGWEKRWESAAVLFRELAKAEVSA